MTLPLDMFFRRVYLNGDNSMKLRTLFDSKEGTKIRRSLIDWLSDIINWLKLPSKYVYNSIAFFDHVISINTPINQYQLILTASFSEVCDREFIPVDLYELYEFMNHLYPLKVIEDCCHEVSVLLDGIEIPSLFDGVSSYLWLLLKNEQYYSICLGAMDPILEYVLTTFPFFCANSGLVSCAAAILVTEACQCCYMIKDISFVLNNPLLDDLHKYYFNLYETFQKENSDLLGKPSNSRKFDTFPYLKSNENKSGLFLNTGFFHLIEN
eukprot:TRINITY_DN719_c0_g1_i1.p1 TRINITY_DN719_c0_g1~~TRINITY_DN719_c0_g1_i1.p1  ORF type:complete len:267 (-),score=61.72 TRINITY_DN719_c0_g1_i1:20-820(-)